MSIYSSRYNPRTKTYDNTHDLVRNRQIVVTYFDTLNLEKVGKKFGSTRERVRQIMEEQGYNPTKVKRAVLDYRYCERIETTYHRCAQCGRGYQFVHNPNRQAKELCIYCYCKIRNKLNGYKYTKNWQRTHREKHREDCRKYYAAHREEILRKQKLRKTKCS